MATLGGCCFYWREESSPVPPLLSHPSMSPAAVSPLRSHVKYPILLHTGSLRYRLQMYHASGIYSVVQDRCNDYESLWGVCEYIDHYIDHYRSIWNSTDQIWWTCDTLCWQEWKIPHRWRDRSLATSNAITGCLCLTSPSLRFQSMIVNSETFITLRF